MIVDLGIRGRRAIVNGGSAGMGKGSAFALAREGVDLVISARGEDRLLKTCDEIQKETNVNVIPIKADHSTDEGRNKILSACPEPDILVGTCTPPPFTYSYEKVSAEEWRETLDVSLLSPVEFMRATIPGMVKRKWGRIVNCTTIGIKYGGGEFSYNYNLAKHCLEFIPNKYKIWAKNNVLINNIRLGHAKTKIHKRMKKKLKGSKRIKLIPMQRMAEAYEIANYIYYMASEKNSYMTGQTLSVSGGE